MTTSIATLLSSQIANSYGYRLWQNFCDLVANNQQTALGIALVLILILLLIAWSSRRARRDFRVYNDEGGSATVSSKALRHLIQMTCEEVGTASSPRIRFNQSRGRVNVQIAIKLYQDQRLNQIHEQLRQRIRATFEETHGIQVGNVSLKVIGFKKSRNQQSTDSSTLLTPAVASYGAAEASAASLYEEPVTDDTFELPNDSGSAAAEETDSTAKRRGWGLFGRREKADTGLIIDTDPAADTATDSAITDDSATDSTTAGDSADDAEAKASDSATADADTDDTRTDSGR